MLLVIDNYDSFVHNLARYLQRLGQQTLVVRHDAIDVAAVRELAVDAIVLSPGPCAPDQAGCCLELVRALGDQIPMLGVCLGHQVIGQALGAKIVRAPQPVHGRSSWIEHHGDGLFEGLPNPLQVGRYHSLVIDPASLPTELRVTARSEDGVVMAIEHQRWPLFGVQFHPESVLTEFGYELLATFLRRAGLACGQAPDASDRPIRWGGSSDVKPNDASSRAAHSPWPAYPVHWRRSEESEQ